MKPLKDSSPVRNQGSVGIVLAAGRSERMGSAKALLTIPDASGQPEYFVQRAVRTLREAGIVPITVVVNPETRAAITAVLPPTIVVVVNPKPEDGMVSSIRVALASQGPGGTLATTADRVVVTLVDIPEIQVHVVQALMATTDTQGAWFAIPDFEDGHGHPLLLYRAVFPELERTLPRGLKTLIEEAPERIVAVSVEGRQPWDVDTPKDYRRYES